VLQAVGSVTPAPTQVILPTISLPTAVETSALVPGAEKFFGASPTPTRAVPLQSTEANPTSGPTPEQPVIVRDNNPRAGQFSPPPELAPRSLDYRDHFWFRRPVDASSNSNELYYYTYGSMGPNREWRVHHGLDMPNPIGKEVRAAGDGRVIWAGDNYVWKRPDGNTDRAYSYGNVVIIEHNFGWQGQRLYTLYAHLQLILPDVVVNREVRMGEVIGLSGASGVVSGPHVHFEVRVGENWYYATRNPLLWMTPYEGHGVVAGRILYANGLSVEGVTVYLQQGRTAIDRTTTYVNPKAPNEATWNVISDDVRNENWVIGDVPAGDYLVYTNVNGLRFERRISVRPGTTTFVDFGQVPVFNATDAPASEPTAALTPTPG
jgi:murein DD-endopeptidase MepM/ murein hydrolase activator NlpD